MEHASHTAGRFPRRRRATAATRPLISIVLLFALLLPSLSHAVLVSALLPASRSAVVGTTVTAFATVINAGELATDCSITPTTPVAADFFYQTTDPVTNALTGTPDTPVDMAAGAVQSFVIGFTPSAPFASIDVAFAFDCTNTEPAASTVGLNTLLLSSSTTGVPDIVALAATTSGDGVVELARKSGAGAFAVATVNVGTTASITASIDTGATELPVTLLLCETNPTTGACISDLGTEVDTQISANATPTFAIFPTGTEAVEFDPGNKRVFVRFRDDNGEVRGATSVAVKTLKVDVQFAGGGGIALREGSLPDDAIVTTEPVNVPLLPEDFEPVGSAIRIAADSEVQVPVTIRLPIPPGVDGQQLQMYRVEEGGGTTILLSDIDGNELVANTLGFSHFGVFLGVEAGIKLIRLPEDLILRSGTSYGYCFKELFVGQSIVCSANKAKEDATGLDEVLYGKGVWSTFGPIKIVQQTDDSATVEGLSAGKATITLRHLNKIGLWAEFTSPINVLDELSTGDLPITFFVNKTQGIAGVTPVKTSVRAEVPTVDGSVVNLETVEWEWDFGDGTKGGDTTAVGEIFDLPEHVYQTQGSYLLAITALATGPTGTFRGLARASILVNKIILTVKGPRFLADPKTVIYTVEAQPEGGSYTYLWKLGDKMSAPSVTQQKLEATFSQPGEHSLAVQVTNAKGDTATVGHWIKVQQLGWDTPKTALDATTEATSTNFVASKVVALADNDVSAAASGAADVTIAVQASGGVLINAGRKGDYTGAIDWGDGVNEEFTVAAPDPTTGGTVSLAHTYGDANDRTITASVTDVSGNESEEATQIIEVDPDPVQSVVADVFGLLVHYNNPIFIDERVSYATKGPYTGSLTGSTFNGSYTESQGDSAAYSGTVSATLSPSSDAVTKLELSEHLESFFSGYTTDTNYTLVDVPASGPGTFEVGGEAACDHIESLTWSLVNQADPDFSYAVESYSCDASTILYIEFAE